MLGPPRDKLPYSLDYALYPLSCPLGSDNAERLDTLLSHCIPPVGSRALVLLT